MCVQIPECARSLISGLLRVEAESRLGAVKVCESLTVADVESAYK